MDVTIRDARLSDVKYVLSCNWPGIVRGELHNFGRDCFSEDGARMLFLTGYPETFFVAEIEGRVVGYLHFFTDCYDDYHDEILGTAVDPTLSSEGAATVREKLKYAYDHNDCY